MFLSPNFTTNLWVILFAAPLSAMSLPSMAPKTSIMTKEPIVFPIPSCTVVTVSSRDNPPTSPTNRQTKINEMKVSSLTMVIKKMSKKIPRIIGINTIKRGLILFDPQNSKDCLRRQLFLELSGKPFFK